MRDAIAARKRSECYYHSDATYVNGLDLAPWPQIRNDLLRWQSVRVSGTNGCMDLYSPLNTNTTLAIEDESCPVLLMIEKLRELNFIAFSGRIEHTNLEKVFDCRKVLSKKNTFGVSCSSTVS